jgi:hypothetical protein
MSIIEGIASQAICSGGQAIEVEYKDGYEEVFSVGVTARTGVGFQLKSSSDEARALRADLYEVVKKRGIIAVEGREYELRCRIYDSFGEDAFRLEWKPSRPVSKLRARKSNA